MATRRGSDVEILWLWERVSYWTGTSTLLLLAANRRGRLSRLSIYTNGCSWPSVHTLYRYSSPALDGPVITGELEGTVATSSSPLGIRSGKGNLVKFIVMSRHIKKPALFMVPC